MAKNKHGKIESVKSEEYDDIKEKHPQATEQQLRDLRLCALRVRENYRQQELRTGKRKELSERDRVTIAVPVFVFTVLIICGLIYSLFHQ